VVALLAVVCAALVAVTALPVGVGRADPGQLRERMLAAVAQPYQGYAESIAHLQLPDLPQVSDVTALLNGTTRIRAWYAGPQRWRVDVLGPSGERDLYQTERGLVVWDYGAGLFTEVLGEPPPVRLPRATDLLPPDLARRLLSATAGEPIAAAPPRRVAGIDAAGLRVSVTDRTTTVAGFDVWADPATGLPLRVEVRGRRSDRPAVTTAFSEVSLRPPAEQVLSPAPGPGTARTATGAGDLVTVLDRFARATLPGQLAGRPRVSTGVHGVGQYGAGLSTLVVLPLPPDLATGALDKALNAGGTEVTLARGTGAVAGNDLLTVLVAQSPSEHRSAVLAGLVDGVTLQQAADELFGNPQ